MTVRHATEVAKFPKSSNLYILYTIKSTNIQYIKKIPINSNNFPYPPVPNLIPSPPLTVDYNQFESYQKYM